MTDREFLLDFYLKYLHRKSEKDLRAGKSVEDSRKETAEYLRAFASFFKYAHPDGFDYEGVIDEDSFFIPSSFLCYNTDCHSEVLSIYSIRCEISNQEIIREYAVRFQESEDAPIKIISRRLVSASWWYDKKRRIFTNYKFDYLAYDAYKKSPRFWNTPHPRDEVFGHEFELCFPSLENKLLFADHIKRFHQPCICEKDGSLDNGVFDGPSLELITPPWTLEDSKKNLSLIMRSAVDFGAYVPSDGYGWHITVNCHHSLMVRRLIFTINHDTLRNFFILLGRRNTAGNKKDYCKFIHFDQIEDIDYFVPENHCYATNRRMNGSLELRFMRSTVDIQTICDTLEEIKTLKDFISDENFNLEQYKQYVRNRKKTSRKDIY